LRRRVISDAELAKQISEQLFDNAMVAAGLLEDPREMVKRMNSLLEKLLAKEAKAAG
jgi:HSP90 family molecular chaperone